MLKNDSTFSFLTSERYQVDLKFCRSENLQFLLAFKSNNDFGALLGHLLTPLKLKWSECGLSLRLEMESVPGLGSRKKDFLLSRDLEQVCHFLGIPKYSFDGKTSLSSKQVFEILTSSRVFFCADYSEKYKIKERRKKRPLSDAFFTFVEENEESLETEKRKLYQGDKLEALFIEFRSKALPFNDYAVKICEEFGKGEEELVKTMSEMTNVNQTISAANAKFGFHKVLRYKVYVQNSLQNFMHSTNIYLQLVAQPQVQEWLPDLEAKQAGKVLQILKCNHSGEVTEQHCN